MNDLKQYRLINRLALEAEHKLTINEDNSGYFSFSSKIDGVKEPLEFIVKFHVIGEEFILFTGYRVHTQKYKIGAKREEKIEELLTSLFLENESLYAEIETEERIAFGRHDLLNDFRRKQNIEGYCIQKMNSSAFELLAVEEVPQGERHYNIHLGSPEYHYFYDPQHQWLLTRQLDNDFEVNMKDGETKYALRSCFQREAATTYKVLDEKGHLYHVDLVDDPENIKLFVLDYDGKFNGRQSEGKSYDRFLTYREASEQANLKIEDGNLWPSPDTVPFTAKQFEIHSIRVIGKEISQLPIGHWVQTVDGKGRIASTLDGAYYEVCLEGSMKNAGKMYLHRELEPIENPVSVLPIEKLVSFNFYQDYAYGFGHAIEETEFYVKIKPLSKVIERVSDHYLNKIFSINNKFIGRDRLLEDCTTSWTQLHGTELDFIYIPKNEVKELNEEASEAVLAYFDGNAPTEPELYLKYLLKAAKINIMSFDYLIFHLLQLCKVTPAITVLDEFSERLFTLRQSDDAEKIVQWLQEKQ